jgi:hypothetical protein
VLENHGYLLVDAAVRERGIEAPDAARVPHPEWMDAGRVRGALGEPARGTRSRRLHLRRRGEAAEKQERAG